MRVEWAQVWYYCCLIAQGARPYIWKFLRVCYEKPILGVMVFGVLIPSVSFMIISVLKRLGDGTAEFVCTVTGISVFCRKTFRVSETAVAKVFEPQVRVAIDLFDHLAVIEQLRGTNAFEAG
jgi:hypothetical protein